MKNYLIKLLIEILYRLDPEFIDPRREMERLPEDFGYISLSGYRDPKIRKGEPWFHVAVHRRTNTFEAGNSVTYVRKSLEGHYTR